MKAAMAARGGGGVRDRDGGGGSDREGGGGSTFYFVSYIVPGVCTTIGRRSMKQGICFRRARS